MTTVLDATTVPGARSLYRLAVVLAAVSGAFCILFCVFLAVNYHGLLSPSGTTEPGMEIPPSSDPSYRLPASDSFNRLPTDYHSFLALRHALAQDRQNDELKTQIRQLDHELRRDFFQRRATIERTALLLLASSVLFFAAMRTISVLKRRLPDPGNFKSQKNKQGEQKSSWHFAIVASWLMLFGGLYAGLVLAPPPQMEQIFLAKLVADADAPPGTQFPALTVREFTTPTVRETALPRELGTASPESSVRLTEEILAQNWVSFRNFDGNGIGFSDNPPIRWDGTTGENIVWQSEVPLPGHSSPVIWGDKLFLTGADEETQKIFCYNIENGELLWTADVTRPETKLPEDGLPYDDTGFAAPTPVVDGMHVYAMFANGELVAVDFSGNLVWRKSFGIPDNTYGFASSPALYFDRLIVQFDDGEGIVRLDNDETKMISKLVALDLNTGSVIWETPRELSNSWASPTIKKIGDSYQIITCANPYAIAYNPENGEEIWRVRCLSGDVGSSAISFGDVVLVVSDLRITAIDATGTGTTTTTHVLWTGGNSTSDTVSPLATENYFLALCSGGWLAGYDPTVIDPTRRRARYWELEIGDMAGFYSSPLRVGTYVYMFCKTGVNEARGRQPKAFIVDLSQVAVGDDGMLTDEAKAVMMVAENPMPEPIVTSPAILNNRIYIRGETMIYCIGEN